MREVDIEIAAKQARKITQLVREAKFKESTACVEDIIYAAERELSRGRIAQLIECSWVEADKDIENRLRKVVYRPSAWQRCPQEASTHTPTCD